MIRFSKNRLLLSLVALISLSSCHEIETYDNNPQGNFDALCDIIDNHYCFLEEKGLDWDAVKTRYRRMISPDMKQQELFQVCSDMLDELRDGHTNLSTPFATSYYRAWWSDYPQNYDARIIEQYYFNFNYRSIGAYYYGILPDNIGYIRCPSFEHTLGDGNWDYVFSYLATCDAIVIDIRDNGGGRMDYVEPLVSRFITERTLAGYISHKTGPGHDDFSSPRPFFFDPAPDGCVLWMKPVAVLTNRSTFSAANNFASIMKLLPQVKMVGATTGGGSGMPFSSELPNGWSIRFSAASVLDAQGNATEWGVEPSPGCAVDMDPDDALKGIDTILDHAIKALRNNTSSTEL